MTYRGDQCKEFGGRWITAKSPRSGISLGVVRSLNSTDATWQPKKDLIKDGEFSTNFTQSGARAHLTAFLDGDISFSRSFSSNYSDEKVSLSSCSFQTVLAIKERGTQSIICALFSKFWFKTFNKCYCVQLFKIKIKNIDKLPVIFYYALLIT